MEMRGQLHSVAALLPGKSHSSKDEKLAPAKNQTHVI
jgi:hypothetical protein